MIFDIVCQRSRLGEQRGMSQAFMVSAPVDSGKNVSVGVLRRATRPGM